MNAVMVQTTFMRQTTDEFLKFIRAFSMDLTFVFVLCGAKEKGCGIN